MPEPTQATPRSVMPNDVVADCRTPPSAVHDEREHERGEQATEHPLEPAQLQAEQGEDESEVPAEDERAKLSHHGIQLVECE